MKKFLLITSVIISFFLIARSVSAENGCGGNMWCASTKVVNKVTCTFNFVTLQCDRGVGGSETVECTATADDCYTYANGTSCIRRLEYQQCDVAGTSRVSCCTSGGGSGGYNCPAGFEWGCSTVCKTSCKPGLTNWCGYGGIPPNLKDKYTCQECGCKPIVCAVTQASNFDSSGDLLTWIPGDGAVSQKISICTDFNYTSCLIANQEPLSATQSYYPLTGTLSSILNDGTFYYVKIVTYKDATCETSATYKFLSSCNLSTDKTAISVGENAILSLNLASTSEDIDSQFVSGSPSSLSTSTINDRTGTATGLAVSQNVEVNANVNIGAVNYCTSNSVFIDVAYDGPWWQVVDGDVTTNGAITSDVPAGSYFSEVSLTGGGYPGVPTYGGSLSLGEGGISPEPFGWNANTTSIFPRTFDFNYFTNLMPDLTNVNVLTAAVLNNFNGNITYNGYEWYYFNKDSVGGHLQLSPGGGGININNGEKVVLFVDNSDLWIHGNITVEEGSFLAIFVDENIYINPDVTDVQGIYLTDGIFDTGAGDQALNIRGSVAALTNLDLNRNLVDDTSASTVFTFAPDLIVNFPNQNLGYSRKRWSEVAP